MEIKPIKTDDDHREVLKEIDRLWNAPEGTPDGDRLDVLVTLSVAYEEKRWPIEHNDPVETIKAHMEWNDLRQVDLAKVLGSRSRASEILNRRRPLTLDMIHKLNREWRIPVALLIEPYEVSAA